MAQCGACTVILRGQVVRSCVVPVNAVGQDEVTTLEGLGTPDLAPDALARAARPDLAARVAACTAP